MEPNMSISIKRKRRKRTFQEITEETSKETQSVVNKNKVSKKNTTILNPVSKKPIGRPRKAQLSSPKALSDPSEVKPSISVSKSFTVTSAAAIKTPLLPCTYTMEELIHSIRSKKFKKVSFLIGAGISVGAGIPDFRSPKSGLYAQVKQLGLPHPEDIFNLDSFQENPQPFYTVAKEFFMSNSEIKPVSAHYFMKYFQDHHCLHYVYTQNIDGLEQEVGIIEKKLVQAHGHLRQAHCCSCHQLYSISEFFTAVSNNTILYCTTCQTSEAIVKPQIIMFGEKLPRNFHTQLQKIHQSDLVIIMGTSLKVQPFSTLLQSIGPEIPIVVINRDLPSVPSLLYTKNEVEEKIPRNNVLFLQGDIQEIVKDLMQQLGWE
jgi:NAD-dependent SIR2 family protein deacetylase